jgi:hypothetical protein
MIAQGGANVSTIAQKNTELVELLPENEQDFAYEFIKRLVLAWDGDFTKLTPAERSRLEKAEEEFKNGELLALTILIGTDLRIREVFYWERSHCEHIGYAQREQGVRRRQRIPYHSVA